MSMKSMQSRHLPFAFLTRTMLANHSGYSTSLIAFAWRSLSTSSLIALCLSRAKLLLFYLTPKGGIDIQLVGNHYRVDPAHVFLFPREYLHVLLQKTDERASDAFR